MKQVVRRLYIVRNNALKSRYVCVVVLEVRTLLVKERFETLLRREKLRILFSGSFRVCKKELGNSVCIDLSEETLSLPLYFPLLLPYRRKERVFFIPYLQTQRLCQYISRNGQAYNNNMYSLSLLVQRVVH